MQPHKTSDVRSAVRKNMFLAAMLCGPDGRSPVKLRNMSRGGAMLEAPVLPPPGTATRLVRGTLEVLGRIAWQSNNHCGIQFASAVSVDEWLAPVGNSQQERVDAVIARLKGGPSGPAVQPAPVPPAQAPTSANLGESLRLLSDLLDKLGSRLSSDPATAERHAVELQSFDIAVQMLESVRKGMMPHADHADDRRLTNLRAACREALGEG